MSIDILVSDRGHTYEAVLQGFKLMRTTAKSSKSPETAVKMCAAKHYGVTAEKIVATPPGGRAVNSQKLLGKPRPITGLWTARLAEGA
jgi:hypothetical protein